MKIKYYHINAFANDIYSGNPAIICLLNEWLEDELMLKIAKEFNQLITGFLLYKNNEYSVRWFTTLKEFAPCGHGSLAAAYVIKHFLDSPRQTVSLHSTKGDIKVNLNEPLSINLPRSKLIEIQIPSNILDVIGVMPVEFYQTDDRYVAILTSEEEVVNTSPNFELIKSLGLTSLTVTARGESYDFVSRGFGPNIGINEDPVTGSTHAIIAPYWAEKLNKHKLIARQLSYRPGDVNCLVKSDVVELSANCHLFAVGEFESL